MKEQILEFIKKRGGGVTFAELSQLEGFAGDSEWLFKENIVLWSAISEEFIEAMRALLRDKSIIIKESHIMVYAYDGTIQKLPIAKNLSRDYKTLRWFPVVFWTPEQLPRKQAMNLSSFLSRFNKVRKTGHAQWLACCSAHDDQNPSLAIKDDNGTIIFHCFGCGAGGFEICESLGIQPSELFPPNEKVDYSRIKKRTYFPPDQILKALHFETLVVFFTAKKLNDNQSSLTNSEALRLRESIGQDWRGIGLY